MKTILIVDDEELFLDYLVDTLSIFKNYFNVKTAHDGAEAVKILKSSTIALVITDLIMPKMDGFELTSYVNRNCSNTPVILMTCYGTPKIESIMRDMGVFHYMEKPLDHPLVRLIPGRHYRPEAIADFVDELVKYIAKALGVKLKKRDFREAREKILCGSIISGTKQSTLINHYELVAFNTMKKAAEEGSVDDQFAVGFWYYSGETINKNDKEAARWFSRAVFQGDVEAQLYLGHMYLRGDGVNVDKRKGLRLIINSAERCNVKAQFYLAWMYRDGDGVEKDENEALKWFKEVERAREVEALKAETKT